MFCFQTWLNVSPASSSHFEGATASNLRRSDLYSLRWPQCSLSQLKPHFHLNWQFPKWNKRYSAAEPSSSGWQDVIHLMTANVRMKIMRWIFLTGKKKNYSVHFQCKTLTYTLIIQSKMCFVQFSPDDFWYGSGTPKTLTLCISWCKYMIYFVIELLLCHQKSLLNDEDCK